MASLAFNALAVSPKPVALLPTRYKSQNYAVTVQRIPLSSNVRFRLNAVPQTLELLSPNGRGFKTLWCTSASMDGDAEIEFSPEQRHLTVEESAIPVVMEFYEAINRRDLKALSGVLSDKCQFHDLAFPQAFEGKEAILQYAKDLMDAMGKGMLFKIDGKTEGHDLTVAVLWHLEWQGQKFPFSKGCGIFYCEKQGNRIFIRMAQDFKEPPLKPGELILRMLKTVTSFFERFPFMAKKFLANPYYAFEGIIRFYRKYLNPILWPIISPFLTYYRWLLNTFLQWATCLIRIVLKIVNILSFGNGQK